MKTRWLSGLLLLALMATAGGPVLPLTAEPLPNFKIASNLSFLLSLLEQSVPLAADSALAQQLDRIRSTGVVEVTARFERELTSQERAQIEALGVSFEQAGGKLAHLGPIYGLLVPPETVPALTRHVLVSWLEAVWQPVALSPLDFSVRYTPGITYVDAPAVWSAPIVSGGVPLTGQGVVIADFDTGVDVMHPAFLKGTYGAGYSGWDTDGNGSFTSGVDTLGGVVLRFWDAVGDPLNVAGVLDVTRDWIYGDNNGNSAYDATETVYMAYDANGSQVLEAGEYLIVRGNFGTGIPNSKIAATLDGSGTSRLRGVDLEQTPIDANGHGTSVSGILGAGAAYWNTTYAYNMLRYYTGLAPDADLLVADAFGLNLNSATYISWASSSGADIMLYEYGSWIQQYLDGSSNHEQLMDQASQNGILQVVPTGNLHCAGTSGCNPRHLQYALPSGLFSHFFNVPALSPHPTDVWGTLLWLNPANNLTVQITTPTGGLGNTVALLCVTPGTGWQYVMTADGHQIGCERAVDSTRGTAMYNIWINRPIGVMVGNWIMGVNNPAPVSETTNFYIADSATGWAFGVGWLNAGSGAELHTATWPSTCDSCLGVASYATRANYIGTPGALSWFSGRGTRFLDGALIVDVAAPGHYDIIAPESSAVTGSLGSYNATFGGTSAAGPHVAGAAALLYQYAQGQTTPYFVTEALRRGAVQDATTGGVPNSNWGYGKLSAPNALHNMLHDLGDAPASANAAGAVMTAYPGVQANFPTVYGVPVPGPLHWASGALRFGPWDSQLGVLASAEGDADVGYDEDPTNNLQPLVNLADLDQPDDGLAFPGPVMPCAPFILSVQGLIPGVTPGPWNRLINVWMDGNTDGDWADVHTCITVGDAPEWAAQNIAAPAPGPFALPLPVTLYQNAPGDPFWIRVSIAEQPAPLDPSTGRADGRGPALGYAYGETEDYLYPQTNFQATVPATCGGGTVNFTHDPASSWPVNFTWDFGDGTIVANPGVDPSHAYAVPGTYTVTLMGDDAGIVFSVYQQTVTLFAPPTVSFSNDSPVCLGQTMYFTDTTPGAAAWHWDFGGAGT
ncbi:MAG: S8 family serine peptidase, partial [Anaerolineae bacterium]|nr:S8 family serine peptidase [Anaerolineae bacterium]